MISPIKKEREACSLKLHFLCAVTFINNRISCKKINSIIEYWFRFNLVYKGNIIIAENFDIDKNTLQFLLIVCLEKNSQGNTKCIQNEEKQEKLLFAVKVETFVSIMPILSTYPVACVRLIQGQKTNRNLCWNIMFVNKLIHHIAAGVAIS